MSAKLRHLFTKQYHDPEIKIRMAGLDSLRALAIILVFLFHYPWIHMQSDFGVLGNIGWCGVDLFFVLSGYLIGNQLLSKLAQGQTLAMGKFYYRRLMRTLPDYWFVLILYLWVPGFQEQHGVSTIPLWKLLSFTQNFGLHTGAFSQTWSLCVEEQFYLIFPLICLWLLRKRTGRLAWGFILTVLVLEILLRAGLWEYYFREHGLNPAEYMTAIYYPTYTRLTAIILGIAIALLKNFHQDLWNKLTPWGNLFLGLGLIGCGISFYIYRDFIIGLGFYQTVFAYPFLDLSLALLVLSALCPNSYLCGLYIPYAKTLAIWSYAAYLLQKPMITMTNQLLLHEWNIPSNNVIAMFTAIAATLLASWLLYTWVERPFLKLREQSL